MAAQQTAKTPPPPRRTGEYTTFALGGEEYAVGIRNVQEIIGMRPITRLPRVPAFIRGVLNLRGAVIPIVDLALRLGCDGGCGAKRAVILVVEARGRVMGLIVDRVTDVLALRQEDLQTPAGRRGDQGHFVTGVAEVGERLLAVLDVEELLSPETLEAAPAAQQAA